jgi:hypothetical protein
VALGSPCRNGPLRRVSHVSTSVAWLSLTRVAVAADLNSQVHWAFTILAAVSFQAAVAANLWLTVGAVFNKVACLAAMLALDISSIAGLGAFRCLVARLVAVATGTSSDLPRLLAITDTMSFRVAVVAFDTNLVSTLHAVLSTALGDMAKLTAIATLRNAAVHWDSSIVQALNVLLWCLWPGFLHESALGFGAPVEPNVVLAIKDALKIHERKGVGDLLLLYSVSTNRSQRLDTTYVANEMSAEIVLAERGFKLDPGSVRDGFDIHLDSLNQESVKDLGGDAFGDLHPERHPCRETHPQPLERSRRLQASCHHTWSGRPSEAPCSQQSCVLPAGSSCKSLGACRDNPWQSVLPCRKHDNCLLEPLG